MNYGNIKEKKDIANDQKNNDKSQSGYGFENKTP